MDKKTTTQLRIDPKIHEKAKLIAERELRSVNNQYEYFIIKAVEQYEKENGVLVVDG